MTTQRKLGGTNVILLLVMMNANLISGEPDNTDTIAKGCSIRKPQST